jgi:hypothetical protein
MTIEKGKELDEVKEALTAFCVDKLFELQTEHAPATCRYSTIIQRFLAFRDRSTSDPEQDRKRKALNKQRNVRDSSDTLRQMTYRAEVLIEGFFKSRTLKDHHFGLTSEIKNWLVDQALEKGAQLDVRGQPAGALDGTVAAYVSLAIEIIALADLPSDWRHQEALTQQRGDAWHRARSTPLLQVPSAIMPLAECPDRNVLINHAHPDAATIRVAASVPFSFDPRLI